VLRFSWGDGELEKCESVVEDVEVNRTDGGRDGCRVARSMWGVTTRQVQPKVSRERHCGDSEPVTTRGCSLSSPHLSIIASLCFGESKEMVCHVSDSMLFFLECTHVLL